MSYGWRCHLVRSGQRAGGSRRVGGVGMRAGAPRGCEEGGRGGCVAPVVVLCRGLGIVEGIASLNAVMKAQVSGFALSGGWCFDGEMMMEGLPHHVLPIFGRPGTKRLVSRRDKFEDGVMGVLMGRDAVQEVQVFGKTKMGDLEIGTGAAPSLGRLLFAYLWRRCPPRARVGKRPFSLLLGRRIHGRVVEIACTRGRLVTRRVAIAQVGRVVDGRRVQWRTRRALQIRQGRRRACCCRHCSRR